MFEKRSNNGYRPALEGVERKTLVHGEKTLMTEFRLRKGSVLPRHAHSHEQTGYLVRGRLRLRIGSEEYEAEVGDSWCIPGGVEHGADAIVDSTAIEVFSPVREDYLANSAVALPISVQSGTSTGMHSPAAHEVKGSPSASRRKAAMNGPVSTM